MQGVIGELAYFLIGECGLVQEIKDYSDLKRQLTDVMDSNDICTPTSKDDPSYLEHHSTDFMDNNDIRTPASKDDPSYLECQLIGVMGSNDICKPTTKDDPSYLALLEFLRQFLPEGLHQTIDGKKVMIFPHQTLNL